MKTVGKAKENPEESGRGVGEGSIKPKGNSYWPLAVVSSA